MQVVLDPLFINYKRTNRKITQTDDEIIDHLFALFSLFM